MIQLRKLVSGVLSLTTALSLGSLGMISTTYAAPLTQTQISLSDSRGLTSSAYTFTFKVATGGTDIKGFKFIFSNRASGTAVLPTGWDGSGASLTSVKVNTVSAGTFAIDKTNVGAGEIVVKDSGTGIVNPLSGNTIEVVLSGIINPSAVVSGGSECDSPSIANTDTCYTRIGTYDNGSQASITAGTGVLDTSVATYTVVTPVTVTATVDPSLTFTVAAVTSGNLATNDSNAGCATPVTSTATTLPFGNLGVGVGNNKCTQHSLTVATNANFGYDTTLKFYGSSPSANMMEGTISGNNIDPFVGHGALYSSPQLFDIDPTGTTANVNTGWLGVRTKNANIGAFSGSALYAPPAVNATATFGDKVMTSTTPDLGSTPTFVTYKIAVNALQPADTYTGTAIYNVVAKY